MLNNLDSTRMVFFCALRQLNYHCVVTILMVIPIFAISPPVKMYKCKGPKIWFEKRLYLPLPQVRVAVEAGAGEVSEDRTRLLEFQIGP